MILILYPQPPDPVLVTLKDFIDTYPKHPLKHHQITTNRKILLQNRRKQEQHLIIGAVSGTKYMAEDNGIFIYFNNPLWVIKYKHYTPTREYPYKIMPGFPGPSPLTIGLIQDNFTYRWNYRIYEVDASFMNEIQNILST